MSTATPTFFGTDPATGELLNPIAVYIHTPDQPMPAIIGFDDWTDAAAYLASDRFAADFPDAARATIVNRNAA